MRPKIGEIIFQLRCKISFTREHPWNTYVILENNQEIRIQVETKSFSQDKVTGDRIAIGWNESDAAVLRTESKS